ncbi:hypothetical protein HZB02_05870 [Candidatus Woesearchaeota archaeon]|nr:hypothetical protein [Candidatus Woesearchaeota archaeon]
MPSTIRYSEQSGKEPRLITYCIAEPIEVLQLLFPSHTIFRYGDIESPFDVDADGGELISGLEIKSAQAPHGTMISQGFHGIEAYVKGLSPLTNTRTNADLRLRFKGAIDRAMTVMFDQYSADGCYLDCYELMQKEGSQQQEYEDKVTQLLELAHVGLGIEKPTVTDLQRILRL